MSFARVIIGLYALLLRLYPHSFRIEFGEEMQTSFTDAVTEAAGRGLGALVVVCLREFRDLPGALFREYRAILHDRHLELIGLGASLKETMMSDNNQNHERPASWAATWAGMLPFLLWGVFLILGEIPHEWAVPDSLSRLRFHVWWGMIILPPLGVGIGWVKNFPRWSYPYGGLALVFGLYTMVAATPGLRFFNYTFGNNEAWGFRAWIPLMVAVMIALLITRSSQPVINLFSNGLEDWTRFTFALFGFMPLWVAIKFDEVDRLYSLPFMVVLTLVMTATALFYLRSTHHLQRVLALAVGIFLTTSVGVLAPRVYWLENGWMIILGAMIPGAIVIALMFAPALVGLLRHSVNSPRHT
jgi:hypothetical protein